MERFFSFHIIIIIITITIFFKVDFAIESTCIPYKAELNVQENAVFVLNYWPKFLTLM